jgi:predicted aspartyl protease
MTIKSVRRNCWAMALVASVGATAVVRGGGLEAADAAFREGRFADAEKLYREAIGTEGEPYEAVVRLGEIALFCNRLDEAERSLRRAGQLRPDEKRPRALLAEVHYRRDEYAQAGALFREVGGPALADKLASFAGQKPYEIRMANDVARIKFVSTDPLPVIEGRVNGKEPVFFIIDTGGAELILNREYGQSVGAACFGAEKKRYAADQEAVSEQARIESFQLGGVDIRKVPVQLLDTSRFAAAAGGRRVDGVVGTLLLNRFIFTLDYPAGELVLRKRTSEVSRELENKAKASNAVAVPYWMAGDHFMVARGQVNKGEPRVLFVDTGLAGGGFLCPESMIKEAGITVGGASFEGVGGGGPVKVTPFTVDELSLGGATQRNVASFAGAFPPSLEDRFGFRIAGLISHAFFRPYAVTFDPVAMRVYLEPREPPPK